MVNLAKKQDFTHVTLILLLFSSGETLAFPTCEAYQEHMAQARSQETSQIS